MTDRERRSIGNLLREHRLRANLSQTELAARMSVYHGIVAKIERGEQAPTRDQLESFISALELESDEAAELRSAYEFEPATQLLPGHTQYDQHNCPYRGLHAFLKQDAKFYCGRETVSVRLADKVAVSDVVAVVGASGCGKSSLVQAGLLPALQHDRRFSQLNAIVFRPGHEPFLALASELVASLRGDARERNTADVVREAYELSETMRRNGIQAVLAQFQRSTGIPLLVVADQFEEVFTHRADKELVYDFLTRFAELGAHPWHATAPIKLVLTLRGDYYGHALAHRALSDVLQDNVVHVPPMNRDELRAAITIPAERGNIRLQPGLLDRIMDDVGSDPGNLPLLEYALTLLWERQRDRTMTISAYDEIGGVRGAIAAQAEQVYSALAPEQQNTARRLLTSLVRVSPPGEEGADTRRRTPRSELNPLPRVDRVLDVLTGARLVVVDADRRGAPLVELAHEAVITAWRRLGVWLEDDRQFILWQQGLRQRWQEWREHDGDEAALLRGAILERAESWIGTKGTDSLAPDLLEYIEASRAAYHDEENRRALVYLDSLRTARADKVPEIIKELRHLGSRPESPAEWVGGADRWRLRLARLADDPAQLSALLVEVPTLTPSELLAVRQVLAELPADRIRELVEQLWRKADARSPDRVGASDTARIRYAALLAGFVPDDARWELITTPTAQMLALESARHWPDWRSAFAPIMDRFIEPLVWQACEGTSSRARHSASRILLEIASGRADVLARIICDLPDETYEVAFSTLTSALSVLSGAGATEDAAPPDQHTIDAGWSALFAALSSMEPAGAGAEEQVAAGRRRANAACTLLRLGRADGVLERFDQSDPETAAQFASAAALRNVPLPILAERLSEPASAHRRIAMLLAMGEYRPRKLLSATEFEKLTVTLSQLYDHEPSAGVHSACGWLARRWDIPFDPIMAQRAYDPSGRRGWFTVTAEDQVLTFSVLRPGTFAMGSPLNERDRSEWESPVRRTTLTRSFAICTAEVTRNLFEAFAAHGGSWRPGPDGWPPSAADPVVSVTWFEATAMCEWLNEQLLNPDHPTLPGAEVQDVGNSFALRLPTEAEWEYACRGGTTTPYSFGSDRNLLTQYAWFEDNAGRRTHEAGILRPNPAGLFNMHGQCWEWCQDWFADYDAEPVTDPTGPAADLGGRDQRFKVLRGGSWIQNEGYARSAARHPLPPENRNSDVSFRLVCTVPEPDDAGGSFLPWTG